MTDDAAPLGDSGDCTRCHIPNTDQYVPVENTSLLPGDICAIHETPFTFVRLATNGPAYNGKPDTHPAVIIHLGSRQRHLRPSAARKPWRKHTICLMDTFRDESDISRLPSILRLFCAPVSPHRQLHARLCLPPHIHTSPEWCKPNAWLIAYPFSSNATIDERWMHRDPDNRRGPFHVDDGQRASILDLSEQKRTEWEELLNRDPDAANQYYKEYKRAHHRINKERQRSQITSAVSTPGLPTTDLPDLRRPVIASAPPTSLPSDATRETVTAADSPVDSDLTSTSVTPESEYVLTTTSEFGLEHHTTESSTRLEAETLTSIESGTVMEPTQHATVPVPAA
ncbi:hypothetical protein C2E23DRAFT_575167 [Lenzites betulinus]|nr:hypothetical protein C2E23DRAFT_575167 [Lenzites betulinus]